MGSQSTCCYVGRMLLQPLQHLSSQKILEKMVPNGGIYIASLYPPKERIKCSKVRRTRWPSDRQFIHLGTSDSQSSSLPCGNAERLSLLRTSGPRFFKTGVRNSCNISGYTIQVAVLSEKERGVNTFCLKNERNTFNFLLSPVCSTPSKGLSLLQILTLCRLIFSDKWKVESSLKTILSVNRSSS
jgi:hypothetical protein